MKTKLFLLLILLSHSVIGQLKLIEVEVWDEFSFYPEIYEYQITVDYATKAMMYNEQQIDIEDLEIKTAKIENEIKIILIRNRYNYNTILRNKYAIHNSIFYPATLSYIVNLKSIEDVSKLYDKISDIEGITAQISNVIYEEIDDLEFDRQHERLMLNARNKAENLAAIANKEIVDIIEIVEIGKTSSGDMTMSELFQNEVIIPAWSKSSLENKVSNGLRVTFEMK